MTKVLSNKELIREKASEGISEMTAIVSRTLGPGGLPILIERQGQALNGDPLGPITTKDGVTVASECASEDPVKNLAIQAVKGICKKTNQVAGDGTTTAIVLGEALYRYALEAVTANNLNPQTVKRAVDSAVEDVLEKLDQISEPCQDLDTIQAIATISANGEEAIGSIIKAAFDAVGSEGVITVDEGGGRHHTLEVVEGFQFRRGAESADHFFNNSDRTKFEIADPKILIFDSKMQTAAQLMQVMDTIHSDLQATGGKSMPPIVVIASDFTKEALHAMRVLKAEHHLSICPVRAPHQTTVSTQMLQDLAVFSGGQVLGNGGRNLANMKSSDLGTCKKFVADKYTTTLYGAAGDPKDLEARIESLKAQRENAESPYDAALFSDRIASLAQGIAKIAVGGLTELEVKETYHRIEDAVNAARAAIAEGIVPGGGTTLYRISLELEKDKSSNALGKGIVAKALREPMGTIMSNLGLDRVAQAQITTQLLEDPKAVYNGMSGEVVDYIDAGVVDPVKVTKTALSNAASIASLMTTCGGAITFSRSKS